MRLAAHSDRHVVCGVVQFGSPEALTYGRDYTGVLCGNGTNKGEKGHLGGTGAEEERDRKRGKCQDCDKQLRDNWFKKNTQSSSSCLYDN